MLGGFYTELCIELCMDIYDNEEIDTTSDDNWALGTLEVEDDTW